MLNRASEHLERILTEFAPFPKWGDDAWNRLPEECRKYLIGLAEQSADGVIPVLRATMYMEYKRNGNRSRYEAAYFERRDRLIFLMMGECIEGKGRFIDPIIDLLWAVCEETSWVIPAHNTRMSGEDSDALPDFEEDAPYLDLFSAETGAVLSWVYYFLGERLAQESPLLPKRIEREIHRKVLVPFLKYDNMWWMGFNRKRKVNNWNPWINSNVLVAFLLMEKDPEARIAGAKKAARSAQRFLDGYHPDGGCDEGPSYFAAAGASLLDLLETFYDATGGQFDVFGEPLIANMADYIRHVHIGQGYCVNFADAPSRLRNLPAGLLIRIGKHTNNPELVRFARGLYQDGLARMPWVLQGGHRWMLYRALKSIFSFSEEDLKPDSSAVESSHYFPGIQVAAARTTGGLFFAAKGGHNDESHNHNDVGSYVVYANAEPCIVDAGVGRYSKKTFSSERYTIWAMQSGYHNTAIINGFDQPAGEEYAAHSASFEETDGRKSFTVNIEKAYPTEAGLTGYRRELILDEAANTLTLTDRVDLSECREATVLPLMCYSEPELLPGKAVINGITLHYDPAQFIAAVEEVSLDDPENPITCWEKDTLYRLLLTRTEKSASDEWTLRYTVN
ncbi:MAG: heparinase II/III family protein [Clostridia bacterium]|nr:heparinase II/III family protein [Clostridia bacterium]